MTTQKKRGPGRPTIKAAYRKLRVIALRVNEEEHALLSELAERSHLELSTWARLTLLRQGDL